MHRLLLQFLPHAPLGAAEDAINQAREEFHAYLAANKKSAAQQPDYTDEELLMEERESELEFSGKKGLKDLNSTETKVVPLFMIYGFMIPTGAIRGLS